MTRNVEKFMAAHDPWSRMYSSVFHHNKTRILSKRLGVPMYYAAGAFLALVGYANCHARDGDLDGWDDRDIEKAIGWEGEPGTLAKGMVAAGFLDVTPNGYRIHNRSLYAQSWINASKQQKKRDKNKAENADRVPGTVPPHVPKSSYSLVQHVSDASFAASASDAAARGNQGGFEDMRVPIDSESYSALQRDADAADASFLLEANKQRPPDLHAAPQGMPERLPIRSPSNSTSLAPRQPAQPRVTNAPQHTGAPDATTPCAEIVENSMSMAQIEDAMRCGFGASVRMSVRARMLFKEVMASTCITRGMLKEAYDQAYYWHMDQGSKRVVASTVAQMLESVVHQQRQREDIAANVLGVAHQEQLRDGERPLHTLGGGLTKREGAEIRANAGLLQHALKREQQARERQERQRKKENT